MISGRHSNAAYGQQINDHVEPHCVRQIQRVVYGECGEELAMAYMSAQL